MEIMLTEEEVKREKHMFAPHETSYKLEVKGFIIYDYVEKTSQETLDDQPMTC